MINILMSGCNGRMGQVITRLASQQESVRIVAGYDANPIVQNSYPVYSDLSQCKENVDVIIDFSHPAAFNAIMDFAISRRLPIVMATTGLSDTQVNTLKEASKRIPVFFSANMSLGINLLIGLVKKAARVLEENFDIEIVEKHHNQKIDAPSGTALAIADAINTAVEHPQEYVYDRHNRRKKRNKREIGIHAVRGGTIVGDHSVIFAGTDEIIEINHMAMSKEIFGVGALRAAQYMNGKNAGLYNMSDLLGEM